MRKVDFLVVGSGPAGQKAAIQAAKLGKKVVLVERRTRPGGVTVHTGTIPSKTLRETVLYLSGFKQRHFYGRGYRLKREITMQDLLDRLDMTIGHEIEVIRDQLGRNGVEVMDGTATFESAHRMQVERPGGDFEIIEADKILLATGTKPYRPDHIPFDDETVIDSDGLLKLKELPKCLTIVGAGVIGVEYATIFNALDVKVSIVDGRTEVMEFLDREIRRNLEYHMRERGMVLRLGENIEKIEHADGKVYTCLESGKRVRGDVVLFAAGRVGCTDELNLQAAGLKADSRGRLTVDDKFRTEQSHIYAAGDVIGFPSLASTSMEQGRLAACDAFSHEATSYPEFFPYGIYAVPEISTIGRTERELTEQGIPYEAGVARLRETARGQILGLEHGILKILFHIETRKILGVHILGEGATELIHIGQAALVLGGTLDYFVENVFNYPTLAEAYKVAALDAWNRMPPKTATEAGSAEAKPEGTAKPESKLQEVPAASVPTDAAAKPPTVSQTVVSPLAPKPNAAPAGGS